jgi:hypothetical protein
MVRALARQGKNRRNAVIAGAFIGFVAVIATVAMTRAELHWHSFLLETLLCAAAGYALARVHGSTLWGVLFFGAAYLLAWFLRAAGLDPGMIVGGDHLQRYVAGQGNFVSLCIVVACGGAMGHILRD